jgi:hypothetical protein
MSYLHQAWACVYGYNGKQLLEVSLEYLIEELHTRKPICATGQLVFTEFGLQALTYEELTALVVTAMSRGHVYMKEKLGWAGLRHSLKAVEAVCIYFGDCLPDLKTFLPDNTFDMAVTSPGHYPHIRAIVEELQSRTRVILDQFEGIIACPPEKKHPLFY